MWYLFLHKNNFWIMIFWLIWPFKCRILTILTVTKYHENLPIDSPLYLLFMVNFFSSLEINMILKIQNETFLRITRYFLCSECGSITLWRSVTRIRSNEIKSDHHSVSVSVYQSFLWAWKIPRKIHRLAATHSGLKLYEIDAFIS